MDSIAGGASPRNPGGRRLSPGDDAGCGHIGPGRCDHGSHWNGDAEQWMIGKREYKGIGLEKRIKGI